MISNNRARDPGSAHARVNDEDDEDEEAAMLIAEHDQEEADQVEDDDESTEGDERDEVTQSRQYKPFYVLRIFCFVLFLCSISFYIHDRPRPMGIFIFVRLFKYFLSIRLYFHFLFIVTIRFARCVSFFLSCQTWIIECGGFLRFLAHNRPLSLPRKT